MQADLRQIRLSAGLTVADILRSYPDKRYDAPLYSKIENGLVLPPEPLKLHLLRLCGLDEQIAEQDEKTPEKSVASPDKYNSVRSRWDAYETADILTVKERIRGLMKDGKPRTAKQVSRALKLPITSARPRMTDLFNEMWLEEVDRVNEPVSRAKVTRWRMAK